MPKLKDFKFTNEVTLFGENVLSVYRNKDKKHIVSLGKDHFDEMKRKGYDSENQNDVLDFLINEKYI